MERLHPLKATGLYFSQAILWVKEHPVLTRKDYMGNHEWCLYGWREGAGHQFFGPNNATDVWPIKKVNPQAMIQLTEKPVELAARRWSTRPSLASTSWTCSAARALRSSPPSRPAARHSSWSSTPCTATSSSSAYEQFSGKKAERIVAGAT